MAKGDGDRECETSKAVKELQKKVPPVNDKGVPIHTFSVPGVNRKAGTPGWAKGPATAAAKKAK